MKTRASGLNWFVSTADYKCRTLYFHLVLKGSLCFHRIKYKQSVFVHINVQSERSQEKNECSSNSESLV